MCRAPPPAAALQLTARTIHDTIGQHAFLAGHVGHPWSKARDFYHSQSRFFALERAGEVFATLILRSLKSCGGPAVGDVRLLCAAKATLSLHGGENWARNHWSLSQVSPCRE